MKYGFGLFFAEPLEEERQSGGSGSQPVAASRRQSAAPRAAAGDWFPGQAAAGYWTWKNTVESSFEAVAVVQRPARLLDANSNLKRLFGLSGEGRPRCAQLWRRLSRVSRRRLYEALGQGHPERLLLEARHGDGRPLHLEARLRLLESGRRPRWLLLLRDAEPQSELARALAAVSERENRRLGMELHDDACQRLTGLRFLCEGLAAEREGWDENQAEALRLLGQEIGDTVESLRSLAHGLHPPALGGDALQQALDDLADSLARKWGVRCEVECQASLPRLDEQQGLDIYRICQEAARNAIQHGEARHICLRLRNTAEGHFLLEIEDDGRGFARFDEKRRGLGLQLMRQRCANLGGTLRLENLDAGGACVRCRFHARNSKHKQE